MYLINLLLAHARTRGIPEKNHEHTRALCWHTLRVFQTDRPITEVIIYHCCNRLPRAAPRNITRENLRCIALGIATREHQVERKKRRPKWSFRDPVAFHLLDGKRLIMCSKVRNSVILGDPNLL